MVSSDSPKSDQGRVQILVEACDPSEAAEFAYTVNGILVSDFYSSRYFDPLVAPGVRYSFTGALQEPRQVLRGGYLSWVDPGTDSWWQETWFTGNAPSFRELGKLSAENGSFRSQIDRMTSPETLRAHSGGLLAAKGAGLAERRTAAAGQMRASQLRRQIARLTGSGPGAAPDRAESSHGNGRSDGRHASLTGLRRPPSPELH
jgi:hypothetical protein